MKKIEKIIAITLAVLMLAGLTALSVTADENDTITVSLRIEGIETPLYYGKTIAIAAGSTVVDLITTVNGMEDTPDITIMDGAYGSYISAIDELAEFAYGDMSGWSYRINGQSPTFGIDMCELEDRDEVVCFYGDPFGIGMQYPITDLSKLLSEGIIRFTSIDATYDEEWNEVLTENPVAAALVTFDKEIYTTDENGEITAANTAGIAGFHTLQIERYDSDSGVPTVLRLAPDTEIYAYFADTPDSAWYNDAVKFCVKEGYFVGTDLSRNLFAPQDKMTTAQLYTVLARIAGADLGADANPWYAKALEWAIDNGFTSEEGFEPGASITRETFIDMFYRTAELTGVYDMTLRSDIEGASDYDEIGEEYYEAISWAVATGIIRGTSESGLTIEPSFEVNRATVCQMLYNYYN